MELATIPFHSFEKSITEALDAIDARDRIAGRPRVLIKPNLVTDSPHPITTSPGCCEAIIHYIRDHSRAEIVIAEGCGDSVLETGQVFQNLGYAALADAYGIELVDLNDAPLQKVEIPDLPVFPVMHLPKIAFTHYIISAPVLKAHSLAVITGTLKNMMGFAPPKHYSGRGGVWKKSVFHEKMQQSIIDLNKYIAPDLTVMDASVGMADFHLGGPRCSPPVKKIIAGCNPWEVDREAAGLLGLSWEKIPHVKAGFVT
ncbi:MAG: DUF362 domain-containing protein [Desulfobacterales bacterium]|nr:DUF362 domain-containing protein [Desulfobacterales bacterium]